MNGSAPGGALDSKVRPKPEEGPGAAPPTACVCRSLIPSTPIALGDTISARTTAAENTSARASTGTPAACSGDMYPGVPAMVPAWISVRLRAIPKSMTTTRFDRVSMTFSGLRSRCTNPAAWIASRPASSCSAISPARLKSNGPFSARSSASVVPSTNSIDTISWPSSTTRSNTRQTFAETTWRALRTSRRSRSRARSSRTRSARSALSATSIRSFTSKACQTSP